MARKVKDDIQDDAIPSNVTPEVFRQHWRELRKLENKKDNIIAEIRTAHKRAQLDGIGAKSLAMIRQLSRMDEDEATIVMRQFGFYAAVLGMPFATQADLFPQALPEVSAEENQEHRNYLAAEAGAQHGAEGSSRSLNPYQQGTEEYHFWDKAWVTADAKRLEAAKATGTDVKKPRGRKAKGAAIVEGTQTLQ